MKYESKKIKYSDVDCNIIVAEIIDCLSGSNYYETLRGTYKLKNGYEVLKEKTGFESLKDVLDNICTQIPMNQAFNGDIVLFPAKSGIYSSGVIFNSKILAVQNKVLKFTPFDLELKQKALAVYRVNRENTQQK